VAVENGDPRVLERVTEEGGTDFVPPSARIAVFDNDGTPWCEKPLPIELGFVLFEDLPEAPPDEPAAAAKRACPEEQRLVRRSTVAIDREDDGRRA
jgi:hypothetical protein